MVGVINAYVARLAGARGFKALYISGGGVAAGSCGVPDLGMTTMEDVLIDVRRVTNITDLPVLVDIDTGWGGAFSIDRTVKSMIKAGAAAVHIDYPIGHRRRRHEGIPLLEKKFRDALGTRFPEGQSTRIYDLCLDQQKLEATPVNEFMDMMVI